MMDDGPPPDRTDAPAARGLPVRPPHSRPKFILLHLACVIVFGGLLAFGWGSPLPLLLAALAPVLGTIGATPQDKRTYWISIVVALFVVCVLAAGLFYLALSNFARGRW